MSLSAPQLTQLETHPHTIRLFADFIEPVTVFQADIDSGFYGHNVMEILFENESGDATAVHDGNLTEVFDSSDNSLGYLRARYVSGYYLIVGENDQIDFDGSAGQYFKVYKNRPPWPKFPWADVSGDSPVFYKDRDLAYAAQNDYPPPIPILGPAVRVAMTGDTVTWDASASYSIRSGGSVASYDWEFEGGSPSTSTDPSEDVTYSTAGQYLVKLELTDDQAITSVAYRWIIVVDSVNDFNMSKVSVQLTGTFKQGGWKAKIDCHTEVDLDDLPDRTLVVVYAVADDGNGNELAFGGWPDAPGIYFCGYLDKDTVSRKPSTGLSSFDAVTLDSVMRRLFNFDAFVYHDASPANWLEMNLPDVYKVGNHLLRWHSNVMEIADVHLFNDSTATNGIDMPQGNLFDQLRNMCQKVRQLVVGCSRYGSLHVQRDVQHMVQTDRSTYGKNHDMKKSHYRDDIQWPRRHRPPVGMLELAGVLFEGVIDDIEPLFSRAPGTVPVEVGQIKEISGLAAASQSDLNELSGMIFAEQNNPYTNIRINCSGNWMPALDIFPQAMMKLPSQFTVRGVDMSNEWVVVRSIRFSYTPGGAPRTDWLVDWMVDDTSGRSFFYPGTDDIEPIVPPTPPPPPPPPPPPAPVGFGGKVIVGTNNSGLFQTDNLNDSDPDWTDLNTGLPGTALDCRWFSRDPVNPGTQGYYCCGDGIYRNDSLHTGGTWTLKLSKSAAATLINASTDEDIDTGTANFRKMKPQVSRPGALYTLVHGTALAGGSRVFLLYSFDRGDTWHFCSHLYNYCGDLYKTWTSVGHAASMSVFGGNGGQLAPSAHDPDLVHITFVAQAGSSIAQPVYWRLRELNPVNKLTNWRADYTGPAVDTPGIHVPYFNNPNDYILYTLNYQTTGTYGRILRWEHGGWYPEANGYFFKCDDEFYELGPDRTPGFAEVHENPALFGSYTYDKDLIWFMEYPTGVVAVSEDGGVSWSQKTSVPWRPQSGSGYPYVGSLFFAGRSSYGGATVLDKSMLMVSKNSGDSWRDVSGDLWDVAFAEGASSPIGVTCIAPQYTE